MRDLSVHLSMVLLLFIGALIFCIDLIVEEPLLEWKIKNIVEHALLKYVSQQLIKIWR